MPLLNVALRRMKVASGPLFGLFFAAFLATCYISVDASILAKTTISECVNHGTPELLNHKKEPCETKLIVALTVQANEVCS